MTENSTSPQTFPDAYPDIPNVSHSPKGGSSTIKTFDPLDDVIPATHKDRTLVLCFDGTGDQFDADVRGDYLDRALLNTYPLPPELKHRPILLHAEKGRPFPTDGVLPGTLGALILCLPSLTLGATRLE